MQIPRGPEHLICPLHKRKMVLVCHKCPLWTQIRGKHPQSEAEVDRWDCALALLPLLLVEGAQQSRQAGASADKVATEIRRFHGNMVRMNNLQLQMGPRVMIEDSNANPDRPGSD